MSHDMFTNNRWERKRQKINGNDKSFQCGNRGRLSFMRTLYDCKDAASLLRDAYKQTSIGCGRVCVSSSVYV